ncbi:MAG: MotA/TolQ/ExbB proton channel family protein [Thainema sp.]
MIEFFVAGGVVMIPLLILFIIAILLVVERLLFWQRITRRQQKVVHNVLMAYRRDPGAVKALLKQNIDLPIARIFLDALSLKQATPDDFRLALESATQAELPRLKRFTVGFETIISVAPLLGLLGTILGLITSFASINIGDVGGSNTAEVTGGISEALISTAAGLVVAIFTLLFANAFRSLYKRQIALIQEYGGQLELMYRRWYETARRGHPYASS